MAVATLDDLFLHTLKDIYYAERQIKKALPKMMKKASSPDLQQAIETHLEETEQQIELLQGVFEMLGKAARGVKCAAIEGIIEEAEEIMGEVEDPMVRDAAIIAASQAVEHYEICRYGSLIAWAGVLGHDEAVEPLQTILEQEKATDVKLSELAEGNINLTALEARGESTGGEDDDDMDDEEMDGNDMPASKKSQKTTASSGKPSSDSAKSKSSDMSGAGKRSNARKTS